jgi:asparagine N-glycosylation enzyme membrane subunit Stt3
MEEKTNHKNSVGAFIIIAIGILLLFNNLEIVPWGIWSVLWHFWPIILILWGLDLIFSHSRVGNLLVVLLVLAFLAGLIYLVVTNSPFLYHSISTNNYHVGNRIYNFHLRKEFF